MRKIITALAVLAFSVGLVGAVQAQGIRQVEVGPIHWAHNIGSAAYSDSVVAYATWSAGAGSDTTAWFDITQYPIAYIGAAVDTVVYMPLQFCFTGTDSTGQLGPGDSTRVIVQATNNPANGAVTTVVGRTTGGQDCIEALTFSGRQLGKRYWRAIYWHTYTAMPVVRTIRAYVRIQYHE